MIFKSYKNNIVVYKKPFLLGNFIINGAPKVIKVNKKFYLPWLCSSIDRSFSLGMKKMYSEYLERKSIGINNDEDKAYFLDINSNKYDVYKFKEAKYGNSELFGYIDTTGSASGNKNSIEILKKAIFELIEKNEVFLMWYGMLCKELILNKEDYNKYINYINNIKFICDEFKIILSRNLSNINTVIVVLFNDKKIVGSGVCLELNFKNALKNAIDEAKTVAVSFYNKDYGYYSKYTKKDFKKIYNYILNLCKVKVYLNYKKSSEFKIKDKFIDFKVVYMNRCKFSDGKTIKVYSEELYNCVPIRVNLLKCSNKYLLKKYNIDIYSENIPDCCIV